MMDYLCRYEHISQDFAIVCSKLGVKRELSVLNVSENKTSRWQDFYDEKTAATVRSLYGVDIENFGYDFP